MFSGLMLLSALGSAATSCLGAVPEGWQWTTRLPFGRLTATASSEQKGRWDAINAVDGNTADDEGTWLTYRKSSTSKDRPESAWLQVDLDRPRRVAGVNIFHQDNIRHYRSIDYHITCWRDGDWKKVFEVKGNDQGGWRAHRFAPVDTDKVRITITRSQFGSRMGLNEVTLAYAGSEQGKPLTVVSPPHRCGKVPDLGVITFNAKTPAGTSVQLRTRTAADAGGAPGKWSAWSKPSETSGAKIASLLGEWIQYEAALVCSADRRPILREVILGAPVCIERIELDAPIIPQSGDSMTVGVRFSRPMERGANLLAELHVPGGRPQALRNGAWDEKGIAYAFAPVKIGPTKGHGFLVVGGAKTCDGVLMLHQRRPLVVGAEPILARVRAFGEWMIAKKPSASIFVQGYEGRTLLGLYEITGERRYLNQARKWCELLLRQQTSGGFWGTGYGGVYLADTGSALGLLINLYKHATPTERERIDEALARYVELVLVKGDAEGKPFVHADGSLGVGFRSHKGGKGSGSINKPYTISTALTGAEVFAALHYITGKASYKKIAVKGCQWLLSTMMDDGKFPYILDDWHKRNSEAALRKYRHCTSTYVGEGLIQAWTYIDDASLRRTIEERMGRHIEWLIRDQNADGSWADHDHINLNESRSHGIVNVLLWYHRNVKADPRVADAVRRYCTLLLDKNRKSYVTVLGEDAAASKAWNARFKVPITEVSTSLAGRALIEVVKPAVDCYRWKDKRD